MRVTLYVHHIQRVRGNTMPDTWHAGFWILISGVSENNYGNIAIALDFGGNVVTLLQCPLWPPSHYSCILSQAECFHSCAAGST